MYIQFQATNLFQITATKVTTKIENNKIPEESEINEKQKKLKIN